MPDREFEVSCPSCSVVFSVPAELAGEVAECSECAAVFEIPKPDEIHLELGTETGTIRGKITEDSETATNTVKLSRTSIGMIPSLKDTFTFGNQPEPTATAAPPPPRHGSGPTFAQQAPQQQQRPAAAPQRSFPIPSAQPPIQQSSQSVASQQFKTQTTGHTAPPSAPMSVPSQASTPPSPRPPSATSSAQKITFQKPVAPSPVPQTQSAQQTSSVPVQNTQLPPWTKIQLRPDEQVYGFREIAANPVGIAIGTSFPVLLCIAAVFLAKYDAVISYAIVLAIWLLSFITIAVVSAKSKTFVAFTSLRVIIVSGSKRMEIGK